MYDKVTYATKNKLVRKFYPNKTRPIGKDAVGIFIGKHRIATVDRADYALVKGYKWRLSTLGYAQTNIPSDRTRTVTMQMVILGTKRGMDGDHRDHNKLDCRRSTGNLRICTHGENLVNRNGWAKSGYKGCSKVTVNGHVYYQTHLCGIFVGSFKDPIQAALCYDLAVLTCFPDYAVTNFKY